LFLQNTHTGHNVRFTRKAFRCLHTKKIINTDWLPGSQIFYVVIDLYKLLAIRNWLAKNHKPYWNKYVTGMIEKKSWL